MRGRFCHARRKSIGLLGPMVAAMLGFATGAHALPAKEYRVQESTRCSYGQGCPRMLRNATSHAEQFCRGEGGPIKGATRRDFRCEQRGIYCVVIGRIECRGRFDPKAKPSPTGMNVDPPSRNRTCLDSDCNRFVSHPGDEQEEGTHACPYGYLVVGVSGRGNDLVCEEFPKPVRRTVVETEQNRQGLLACPKGMVVRGVNDERNRLLCSSLDADLGEEEVSEERADQGLQVCAEPTPEEGPARYVTGLDPARQKLMCAPLTPR